MAYDQGVYDRPVHLRNDWKLIPVLRSTDDDDRRAVYRLPKNLPERLKTPTNIRRVTSYWEGLAPDWQQMVRTVTEGSFDGRRLDVSLLTRASGLVVLDCDITRSDEDGFRVYEPGQASWHTARVEYGVNHLQRVVESLGHSMKELLTLTTRTKSGGYHLIFRANPDHPLSSTGHRDGWSIDVKASPNTWIAFPPTPGYRVVRDVPAIMLPGWMAAWIRDLHIKTEPLGGRHTRRLTTQRVLLERGIESGRTPEWVPDKTSLTGYWIATCLELLRRANLYGGWNDQIYLTSHWFREMCLDRDDALALIIEAASPHEDRDMSKLTATFASAWPDDYEDGR
jgi:hypothetical protein